MANSQKPVVSLSRRSADAPQKLKLNQIGTDKYKIRFDENGSIDKDEIDSLMNSIISETQHNAFVVAKDKANSSPEKGDVYELISGYRRYTATKKAIKTNVDTKRFHDDMDVDCIEMVQAKDQSNDDFNTECRLRAATENELHKPLTDDERREYVADCIADGVPENRVMLALGIGQTTYDRYYVVVTNPEMLKHVNDKHIAATTAADLLTAAAHNDAKRQERNLAKLQAKMKEVVAKIEAKIKREKEEYELTDRTYPPRLQEVRNHPEARELYKLWQEEFDNEKEVELSSEPSQGVGGKIVIDSEKGEIIFPRKRKIEDLTPVQIETLIASFDEVGEQLMPILEIKKHQESLKSLDRQAKLTTMREEAKKRREKAKQEATGREPTTAEPTPMTTATSIKDMIAKGTAVTAVTTAKTTGGDKPISDKLASGDKIQE